MVTLRLLLCVFVVVTHQSLRCHAGVYDCEIDLSFPLEREDEMRERRVRREYYPRVVQFRNSWWDPYSTKPRGNLSWTDYDYLQQIDNIRLSRCGISGDFQGDFQGGRWKRQAPGWPQGGGAGRPQPGPQGGQIPHHRHGAPPGQEYRTLTPAQRQRFHNAVRQLKASGHYDTIALRHRQEDAPGAHGGAAFLPFHRMYCIQWEVALQGIDPGVIVPYWDPALESRLGDRFHDTSLFDSYSLGQWRGGPVLDGAFAGFRAVAGCEDIGEVITRQVTQENALYTAGDYRRYDRFRTYQDIAGSSDFEDDHAFIHVTVGGHMDNLNCAPNDPTFFMYHAFVDYIFYRFRRNQITDRQTDYINNATQSNGFNDRMLPFAGTFNRDGLRDIPIEYVESPSMRACNGDRDCSSNMLWCNRGRCTATIREGTQCFMNNPSSCYCSRGGRGTCPGGRCTCR